MFNQIKHWLKPPVFPDDEDKTHQAKILFTLLISKLAFLLFATFATIFIFVQKIVSAIFILCLLALVLISFALVKRGRVLVTSRLFVIGAWVLSTLMFLLAGRVNTTFVALLLALTVITGILLGKRSAIVLTLLNLIIGLGLTLLENAGYHLIRYFPVPPLTGWVAWVFACYITLVPLNLAIKGSAYSLARARQSEKRYVTLFEEAPMMYLAVRDVDGIPTISNCNTAFLKSLGYKRDQVIDQPLARFYTPPSQAALLGEEGFQKAIRGELKDVVERDLIAQDGHIIHTLLQTTPEVDEYGQTVGALGMLLDITERKRAEEMERNRHDLEEAQQLAHIGSWSLDFQTSEIVWSDELYQIFGLDPAKKPPSWPDGHKPIFHPDDWERSFRTIEKALETGESYCFENRFLHAPDSTVGYSLIFGKPCLSSDGNITGYVGSVQDITERKQTELALIESQTKLNAIFDNSRDPILVSKNGVFVMVNPAFLRMLGYEESLDVVGRPVLDIIAPESQEMIAENMLLRARSYPPPTFYEALALRKDGTKFWVELSISAYELDDEVYVLAIARDLTERKQAGEALHASEERYRLITQNAEDIIWTTDMQLRLTYTSPSMERALGYTVEELKTLPYEQLLTPESLANGLKTFSEEVDKARPQPDPDYARVLELEYRRKDGSTLWVEMKFSFFRDTMGQLTGVLGVGRDVTERKQAEETLKHRADEFAILYEIASEIAGENDLPELLNVVTDHIATLFGVSGGGMYLYNETRNDLEVVASTHSLVPVGAILQIGEGMAGRVAQSRQPMMVNDYSEWKHGASQYSTIPFTAVVEAPMLYRGALIGVLAASEISNKVRHFTEDDMRLLSLLANGVAGVIQNAREITKRKQAEARERNQRILAEALSNCAAILNSTLNFDEVLDRVLDYVGWVVPHDAANIMLLDKDNDTLSVACSRGYIERNAADITALQISLETIPYLTEAAHTGQPVIIQDTHADPNWLVFSETGWVSSYLAMPIRIRERIVGFLNLDGATTNVFTQRDAERLQAFVNHAAIAIENARLYEEVQKLAVIDALTGIYNRAFFEAELARMELGRDFPVSFIVADLDNMKATNDTLGHAAGDELLKRTARLLQETFRAEEIIARIGGDEFAILLPKTDAVTVRQMLPRVHAKLAEHNAAHTNLPVQLSIGISTAGKNESLQKAFITADQHMYVEKAAHKSSASAADEKSDE